MSWGGETTKHWWVHEAEVMKWVTLMRAQTNSSVLPSVHLPDFEAA